MLETKKEMRSRGLDSPDRADAVLGAMYFQPVKIHYPSHFTGRTSFDKPGQWSGEQAELVDISSKNLENASIWLKHNNIDSENVKLILCNGIDLNNIKNEEYDIVMSTICMQHICVYDIRFNYFKEFYRILKPGGYITIQMGYGKPSPNSVDYYDNNYEALYTNRGCDTDISSHEQVEKDLLKIGFKNFNYYIRSVGPGDCHPNWIFFNAQK
jgi:SAM-dependent methyltransferase